jgi:hypothetical protein
MKIISKITFTDLTITVDAEHTGEANDKICKIIHKIYNVDDSVDCDGLVTYTVPAMTSESGTAFPEMENGVTVKPVRVRNVEN